MLLGIKRDTRKLQLINFRFGGAVSRPKVLDNKYPGPAHGYKLDAKKGYIGIHKDHTSPPRSNKLEIDDSFQHYYIKTN